MKKLFCSLMMVTSTLVATDVTIEDLAITGEEVFPIEAQTEGRGIINASFPDMVTQGNMPNFLNEASHPDMMINANFPDSIINGNFPNSRATEVAQEDVALPSPQNLLTK